jgi:hypothetical protein
MRSSPGDRAWYHSNTESGQTGGLMTGEEHYRRAELLIGSVSAAGSGGVPVIRGDYPEVIAAAQVHATLALAAASAASAPAGNRLWAAAAAPTSDPPVVHDSASELVPSMPDVDQARRPRIPEP